MSSIVCIMMFSTAEDVPLPVYGKLRVACLCSTHMFLRPMELRFRQVFV